MNKFRTIVRSFYEARGRSEARVLVDALVRECEDGLRTNKTALSAVLSLAAETCRECADLPTAADLLQKNLALAERDVGVDESSVIAALSALSEVVVELGDFRQALKLRQRIVQLRERSSAPDSRYTAMALHNLAYVHQKLGDYKEALRLYEESLQTLERAGGEHRADLATILASMAGVYRQQGRHRMAIALCERSSAISEALLGQQHPESILALQNVAMEYLAQGDYAKSRALIERCVELSKKVFGEQHPAFASCLEVFADLNLATEEFEHAKMALQSALAIKERALGSRHPSVAPTLCKLGIACRALAELEEAKEFLRRGLLVAEAAGQSNTVTQFGAQNGLGLICMSEGKATESRQWLERAVESAEAIFGLEHPATISARCNLVMLDLVQGDLNRSLELARSLFPTWREYLFVHAVSLPDVEAMDVLGMAHFLWDGFHSFCALDLPQVAEDLRRLGAEGSTLNKAIVEEAMVTQCWLQQNQQIAGDDFHSRYQSALAQLTQLPESRLSYPTRSALRQELQTELSSLRTKLAGRSELVSRTLRERQVTVQGIASALSPESALVDLVSYRQFDFNAKNYPWKESRFLAYLTFPPKQGSTNLHVEQLDLGEAAPINEAVAQVCQLIASGQIAEKRMQPALRRLSELVYAPLAKHLTNVEHLIVCPDGQLSRVPFEMLLHDGKYLVEEKTISYVGSGREVARLAQKRSEAEARRLGPSLVMGDPDFDLDLASTGAARAGADASSATRPPDGSSRREEALAKNSEVRDQKSEIEQSLLTSAATERIRSLSRSFTGRKFTRLPAAAEEARSVAKLLGGDVALRLGADAREAELKAVVSPRVLHLATHGFFLSDQEFKHTNSLPELLASNQRPFRRSEFDWENPLIRCGIALAGANHFSNSALRTPHSALEEDGLLTGLEASLLNLQETELVILSACESGTGEIKIGEGVMSLRRAFRIAGAETVLASHWPVSDKATSLLMTEFMRRWRSGEPRAKAWREAQLSLLRSKDFSSPYFWAAFTLTGQWK
ncbi:MAG: CHAT domain-containing protein [Verrucomicrobia bacterium]|nr:CHAT domain-containing protein [Verrucomicrobiota bacterium]